MGHNVEEPGCQNIASNRRDSGFSPVPGVRGGSSSTKSQLPDLAERLVDRKNRPRLQDFDYKGEYAYHVTIRTANCRKAFEDIALGDSVGALLEASAEARHFNPLAYCLMPDHVHFLAKGQDEMADLKKFVSLFKQQTGYGYRQQTGQPLWQVSYFDRVLRREDDLQVVADYVLSNPVKAGLTVEASSYPLSGGLYFENGPGGWDRRKMINPEARVDRAEAAVPTNELAMNGTLSTSRKET